MEQTKIALEKIALELTEDGSKRANKCEPEFIPGINYKFDV